MDRCSAGERDARSINFSPIWMKIFPLFKATLNPNLKTYSEGAFMAGGTFSGLDGDGLNSVECGGCQQRSGSDFEIVCLS